MLIETIILSALMSVADPTPAAAPAPHMAGAPPSTSPELPTTNGGIIVAENGRVQRRDVGGWADYRTRTPIAASTVFQLASGAKPFTSVAVLQLRDGRKLDLDDPVARHLPGFPYPQITIRHLLSHTSGLPDLELFEPLIAREPDHVVTSSDLVPALAAWTRPLRYQPGDGFRYSNINYQLLALIVSRVSGRSFGEYVRERIFRPAGMRSSFVLGTPAIRPVGEPATNHVLAVMFRTQPEDVRRLDYQDRRMMRPYRYEGHNLGSTVGDQNLFSTLDDLVLFDRALSSGRILSLASQEEAYTPVRFNNGQPYSEESVYTLYGTRCSYGLGWEVCSHPQRGRLVGHAGNIRGISTILYRAPGTGRFLAMYDNAGLADFAERFASAVDVANGGQAPPAQPRKRSLAREYGQLLVDAGPTAAMIQYNRLRADTEHWTSTPAGMNQLGYDLLHNGHAALALDPFRLNLVNNPSDASAYVGYAEALEANERKEEAILAYRRALELEPQNERATAALGRLHVAAS